MRDASSHWYTIEQKPDILKQTKKMKINKVSDKKDVQDSG